MSDQPILLLALYHQESFAIRTLHAVLEREGISVVSLFFKERSPANTFEMYTAEELDFLIKVIEQYNPRLVGIGVMSTFFDLASEITGRLSVPVIWGGIHPTIVPRKCLEVVDMVCVGEGDEAIVELARGEKHVQGIWTREEETGIRPLIQDLDSLPFPSCDASNKYLISGRKIQPYDFNKIIRKTGFHFMTARGCPFKCSYCANGTLRRLYKGKGRYLRQYSVDSVVGELKQLKAQYSPGVIMFQDDVFGVDPEWTCEFCRKYRRQVRHPFLCYCQPSSTSREILVMLKRAGLVHVQMGIQSGSEYIRREYYKRYDSNEDIIRAAQSFHDLGFSWGCDILMGNPLETDDDREQTQQLLQSLPQPFSINEHTLTFFPGYDFTEHLLSCGCISDEDVEDRKSASFRHNDWTKSYNYSAKK